MMNIGVTLRKGALDEYLRVHLREWGGFLGRNSWHFVTVPLLLSLFFSTGLQNFSYETDPEYLFVPINALGKEERGTIEQHFPTNYSDYILGKYAVLSNHFPKYLLSSLRIIFE